MSIEPKRGRGRPRDPAKLEAILDAAYDLFLNRGIAATPIDLVAERAGVSKMTVYANFQDKPALLAAVLDHRRKTTHLPDLPVGSNLNLSLDRLAEFGELVVSILTRPEIVRETRLMAECAADEPRLATVFYTAGRGEILKRVAAFQKGLTERGVLAIDDPELAADQLIGAWVGMTELRQSLGLASPPSSNAIAKRVRYAIDTLVRAWSCLGGALSRAGRACACGREGFRLGSADRRGGAINVPAYVLQGRYEAARLHVGTGFLDTLKRDIEGNFTVSYHLAPPLLPTKRDARGRPRKISLGGWLRLPFRWLARMKRLRVTAFDRFGCTAERRAERALIGWYEDLTALLLRSQLRRWTSAATAR